ncbi:glutaredoxin-like [Tasmannia lanceolata]|uniref:glutaredoxin-like n=1 Tax=Tasmannia lanceolata TaxID=3420 RepID=UPI0040645D8E
MALSKAKDLVSSTPIVVFSKTYCGYCNRVKQLLSQLGASYKVIELDSESDEDAMQSALVDWTGQRTVPNVFIARKHIGGCDARALAYGGRCRCKGLCLESRTQISRDVSFSINQLLRMAHRI